MKILYNSFTSTIKSRLADLTDLSNSKVSYYKDTEDIDWFCDSINQSLKSNIDDMLQYAVTNGSAVYYDTETNTSNKSTYIPEIAKLNGNDLMVGNSVKTEYSESNKKYYYKIKQCKYTANRLNPLLTVNNIHDNILRDYMYVEDDSPDLTGVIEWMKMVSDIQLSRHKYISIELCTTHEFAINYNSKLDSISATQAEYLYGVNKITYDDVICFNSIEEVYDDFEKLNSENEKNSRPFEDALIYHLSDVEHSNKEHMELLEYE